MTREQLRAWAVAHPDMPQARAVVALIEELEGEARAHAEHHDQENAAIVELRDQVVRLTAQLERMREAVWPGLPKWTPTETAPQQDFYEAVLEAFWDKFRAHQARLVFEGIPREWSPEIARAAILGTPEEADVTTQPKGRE